ncbi:hypothetical protein LXA43DRAFT_903988 [Ganoderma leucocontextum]|nr:hypothetical protein LXA43DRAFT_903988 [Ganoderma leucocontextum]
MHDIIPTDEQDLRGQRVATHRASIIDPTPNAFHLSDDHAGLYPDGELDPDEPHPTQEHAKTPHLATQSIEGDSGRLGLRKPVAGTLPRLDQEDESAEVDRPMEDDERARSSARSSSGSEVAIAPVAVDNPQTSVASLSSATAPTVREGCTPSPEQQPLRSAREIAQNAATAEANAEADTQPKTKIELEENVEETTSAAAAAEPSLDTNGERKSGTFTQARSGSAPHHHKRSEDIPDGTRKHRWTKMSKAIAVTSRRSARRVASRAREYCEKLKGLGASGWMS